MTHEVKALGESSEKLPKKLTRLQLQDVQQPQKLQSSTWTPEKWDKFYDRVLNHDKYKYNIS